jgi:hypothetical protein
MPYARFLVLSAVVFLISTTGSDVFSRIRILGESPGFAIHDHFYVERVEIAGTVLLFIPFLIIGLVAAWLECRVASWKAWALFGTVNIFLLYEYFEAYEASAEASLAKHWTAAALSIGFLPFLAIPVAIITAFVAFGIVSLGRARENRN